MLGISFIHDGLVLLDYILDLQTLTQCPVILVGVELRGRTF